MTSISFIARLKKRFIFIINLKEIFQQQVPLPLPCYDFIKIIFLILNMLYV